MAYPELIDAKIGEHTANREPIKSQMAIRTHKNAVYPANFEMPRTCDVATDGAEKPRTLAQNC